jgi:hypothetical protein
MHWLFIPWSMMFYQAQSDFLQRAALACLYEDCMHLKI